MDVAAAIALIGVCLFLLVRSLIEWLVRSFRCTFPLRFGPLRLPTAIGEDAMQLTHVRLLVRNYSDSFRFYREGLGLAPSLGDEHSFYAEFPLGGAVLALFDRGLMSDVVGTSELADGASQQDPVAIVLRVEDVDAVHRDLVLRGLAVVTAPHDQASWGIRCCHVRDPAGNLVELNQPLANPAEAD